jgi:hypothetical protein
LRKSGEDDEMFDIKVFSFYRGSTKEFIVELIPKKRSSLGGITTTQMSIAAVAILAFFILIIYVK